MFAMFAMCAVLAAGCSDGGGQSSGTELSPEAAAGLEVATSNGCMACHSVNGRGSVGPTWQGLYGSEVQLEDGTTVTADDAYLTRAILDPSAEIAEGSRGVMPERELDDEDVASLLAYIRSLAD